MTQAVTELIVRGDGALTTLDQFENKMEAAGVATDVTTGAVADFERRMETARQAIERGNAITTQSIERKTAEQRAWDRWSATVDKAQALRIRLEREAQQASVAAANAVNLGYTSQEEALTTLIALEQRHATQLRAVNDANQSVAAGAVVAAAANDHLAMSANRVAAANDNARGATANVAAQFQDIGVTAAMGMSPIMIALQQGTQLSSVLATMKNPLTGLAAAFGSLLSPVSLLTIGFVALAAVAIQWFMGAKGGAEDAEKALKAHGEWLDKILAGYDKVRDAAQSAADAATKLPEGVVRSDLQANLKEQEEAIAKIGEQIIANRAALDQFLSDAGSPAGAQMLGADAGEGLDSIVRQAQALRDLGLSATSTAGELETAMVAARELYNSTDDPGIKNMANDTYVLARGLQEVQGRADATDAALRALPKEIQISVNMRQNLAESVGSMRDLYIDPRSRFDQAREELESRYAASQTSVKTYAEMTGAASEYARVLESINVAEATAADKKASSAGETDAEKMIGHYADLKRGSEDYVEAKLLEAETLSMAADVANRMRNEQDMLNKAANDNIALSPVQREEIAALADAMANADLMLAGAQMRMENRSPFEVMSAEIANLDAMVRAGAISWDEYGAAATRSMAGAASDTLSSMSAISGALSSAFEGNKALAIANTVISTAAGMMKAIEQGGMFGFPMAAAIAATGAAQIATIMSASPSGGGSVRAPSAPAAQVNAPQREKSGKAPDRMDITLHGLDRGSMYSGENIESFLRAIEERAADGRILKIKVA